MLLRVGVCCKSLVGQALLKRPKEVDITGQDIGTVRTMTDYFPPAAP